mmetsp:Transcript_10650/g.26897  ORF Transcript_10650/g.26897 Transcript_10650/m.26897 type:complete len:441 (+) Transcript_10650:151-1473(+)
MGIDGSHKEVIPESILSVSKDGRYVHQCQELLLKAISFLFEQKEALVAISEEQKLELQQARKQATWVISCVLYILVSATRGRTLGMEAVGLAFATNNNNRTLRRRRFLLMCLSVLSAATGSLVWDYMSTGNSTQGEKDEEDPERSRGRERRLIHERLRRQMLERATNLGSTSTASGENASNRQSQHVGGDTSELSRGATNTSKLGRVVTIFRELFKLVFEVYSNSDGPHNLVQNTNSDVGDSRSTARSMALWIVRLHLAHFLLTGKYPTLVHRFLGLKPKRETSSDKTTTVLDRPNTSRTIAMMLLLQASASLVQNTSHWCAEQVAKFLEARARRKSIDQQKTEQPTKAQLRKKLDKVFDNNTSAGSGRKNTKGDKETTMLCTICRLERKNPAAPSSCGHVLCWNCLIQWVSTVRPECPICRAPCTAKDVLPLHNYEPSH